MGNVKIFLDTNILLDVLEGDRPSTAFSNVIFQAVRDRLLEAVLTTQSVVDASYIASRRKGSNLNSFCQSILQLMHYLNIEGLDAFDLKEALLHSTGDFEEDVQFSRALESGCDMFITSDRKIRHRLPDYSGMLVYTPEELVQTMIDLPLEQRPANTLSPQRGR